MIIIIELIQQALIGKKSANKKKIYTSSRIELYKSIFEMNL